MSNFLDGKIFIWGTGFRAKELNTFYTSELAMLNIDGYIDNNPEKWNADYFGKKVFSPDVLLKEKNNYIYIANKYRKEISEQLQIKYEGHFKILNDEIIKRMQIITRYSNSNDEEIKDIVRYLRKNPLQVFNYDFISKYNIEESDIFFDKFKEMYYVYYFGKKMYFAKTYDTVEKVKEYYRSILLEQDKNSPHLYLTQEFNVQKNAVVIDAGVAEGNFSLAIIDRVSKIYMFEPDKDWVEALYATFDEYKEKVVIINKRLSNYVNDNTTTVDTEIKEQINFMKMDIEGEEYYALLGSKKTIDFSNDFKCLLCTYHQEFAYTAITSVLEEWGISYETSKGYMWYPDSQMRPPILRRGIVRGIKKN